MNFKLVIGSSDCEPLKQLLWSVPAREMPMTWAKLVFAAQAMAHQG
jgi:hypothetical protein